MPAVIDLFSNVAATTLAVAVTTTPAAGTSETWTLTSSAAPLPQAVNGVSQYRVTVGPGTDTSPEIVWVTATLTGTTVTVLRGQEGSTVKTHAIGDAFTHTATAGFFSNAIQVSSTTATSKTLQPGEQCFFTGSTPSQTITLPTAPTSSSPTSVTNNSSVNVSVSRGGSDTITHYLTASLTSIVIPPGMGVSFTYVGTVWNVISGTGFVPGQIVGYGQVAPNVTITAASVISGATIQCTAAGSWNTNQIIAIENATGTGTFPTLMNANNSGNGFAITTGGTGSFRISLGTSPSGSYTGSSGQVTAFIYNASGSFSAVDTQNLTFTPCVPPNGKLLLVAEADYIMVNSSAGNTWDMYLGYVLHGLSTLVGAPNSIQGMSTNATALGMHTSQRTIATGLTPGPLALDMATGYSAGATVGAAQITMASGLATLAGDGAAPAVMMAYALP